MDAGQNRHTGFAPVLPEMTRLECRLSLFVTLRAGENLYGGLFLWESVRYCCWLWG